MTLMPCLFEDRHRNVLPFRWQALGRHRSERRAFRVAPFTAFC
jgi:hypothetical protein